MSKRNKVNPGQYTQAGRLSPDDAARERRKQDVPVTSDRSDNSQQGRPTGISNREPADEEQEERELLPAAEDASADEKADGSDIPAGNSENEQTSAKSGSRSGAQKAADSKYVDRPHPAAEKVEGAFGRESGR